MFTHLKASMTLLIFSDSPTWTVNIGFMDKESATKEITENN